MYADKVESRKKQFKAVQKVYTGSEDVMPKYYNKSLQQTKLWLFHILKEVSEVFTKYFMCIIGGEDALASINGL